MRSRMLPAAAGVLALVGCEPVPPQTMADIEFPPGFELDNARKVTLRLEAAPTVDVTATSLSIVTDGGQPVFEGPATYATAHPLDLRLPPGTARLHLTQHGASRITRSEIPLDSSSVAWTLR